MLCVNVDEERRQRRGENVCSHTTSRQIFKGEQRARKTRRTCLCISFTYSVMIEICFEFSSLLFYALFLCSLWLLILPSHFLLSLVSIFFLQFHLMINERNNFHLAFRSDLHFFSGRRRRAKSSRLLKLLSRNSSLMPAFSLPTLAKFFNLFSLLLLFYRFAKRKAEKCVNVQHEIVPSYLI